MKMEGYVMKKLELSVTKENGLDVIRYELLGNEEYDERIADKINQLVNVIPFQFDNRDGKRIITTYVRDNFSLEMLLSKTLQKREVLCLLGELVAVFDMGAQGIPVSYVVKDFNYIYVNEETLRVKCVLVPVKQEAIALSEIPEFFRTVVSRMSFDEIDMDNYVAKLLTIINSKDFSTLKLKNYIDDELEKMGLYISKEKGLTSVDAGGESGQAKSVKVNRLGVMNNMQNARPQMPGQPPMMGQMPNQQMPNQRPMMNQQMPGQQPPFGRPGQPPMMGQMPNQQMPGQQPPFGRPGQPPMMGQMPNQQMPGQQPPFGRPGQPPMMSQMPNQQAPTQQAPKPGVPPMPGQPPMMGQMPNQQTPNPQAQTQQAPNQQAPKPGEPPMPGQPPMMGQMPNQQAPNQQPPKPGVPHMMGQMPNQQAPNPQAANPQAQTQQAPNQQPPKPGVPPMMGQPQMPTQQAPTQQPPKPGVPPMMGQPQMPNQQMQTQQEPKTEGSQMMGGLVGQLNEKPVPHLVRVKTGEIINITKSEFSIGKSESKADYTITDNTAVSRVHCIIVQKNGVNYIKDNNSTNHTYLDGVELEPGKEVLLKNKTTVKMGDEEFTFLLRKE